MSRTNDITREAAMLAELAEDHGQPAGKLAIAMAEVSEQAALECSIAAIRLRILAKTHGASALQEALYRATQELGYEDKAEHARRHV